jgi:hypothetical protein
MEKYCLVVIFFCLLALSLSAGTLDSQRERTYTLTYESQTADSLYLTLQVYTPSQPIPGVAIENYTYWPFWGVRMDGNNSLWPGTVGYYSYGYEFGTSALFPIAYPIAGLHGLHSFQAYLFIENQLWPVGAPLTIDADLDLLSQMNWQLLVYSADQQGLNLRLRVLNNTNYTWNASFVSQPIAWFSVNGIMPPYTVNPEPFSFSLYPSLTYYVAMHGEEPVQNGIYKLQAYLTGLEGDEPVPVAEPVVLNIGNVLEYQLGSGATNMAVPIDFNAHNSLYQCLFSAAELGSMDATITSLAMYNDFSNFGYNNCPVQVYMGETSQSDLYGGWIPAAQLSLVYDGLLNFPLGQNQVLFNLDTPFPHNAGNNLVIAIKRSTDPSALTTQEFFACHAVEAGRSIIATSDTAELDLNIPPAEWQTANYRPNFTMFYQPGTAVDDPNRTPEIHNLNTYPNPFSSVANISFKLPYSEQLTLQVYNTKGQLVRTIDSSLLPSGEHTRTWDGRDNQGQLQPCGVYLLKLIAGKHTSTGKLCYVK